ncbi:MAG: hypothetical protein KKF68_03915 [Nanoarchaeota archaeon]|nr:hypothetical protein [Nanoarchaeota archaeon]
MEKDIGKINKNDMTDIVIRIDDFGGRPGVTIREFVTSERYTGFTKSGVKIAAADFQKFKEMINSITEKDLNSQETSEKEPQPEKGQETLKQSPKKQDSQKQELPDY